MKNKERTLYIRELERFTNRIVSFLKQPTVTKEQFSSYIDKIFEPLDRIEKVYLSKEYPKALERFVQKVANLPRSEASIEEIQEETLSGANQLRKLKRKKKYSRISKKRSEDG